MSAKARTANQRTETRRQITPERISVRQRVERSMLGSARNRDLAICLLFAVVTFAVYSPAIGHPFIFNYDDDLYVINNSHVQAGVTRATFSWALKSTDASNWHPVTWLSHALDCELYALNPHGHHATNVLLHVLNVVLLFLLLTYATGAVGRSFLVAALFAIHPMNVESVAWIAERKNVLSTFFFLLTLGAYGWYAFKPSVNRYLAVAALFVLGLASKPMVVTLPCVLLLLDFWPLRRIQGQSSFETVLPVPQERFSRLILEKMPFFALSAAACAITIFAQRSAGSMRLVLPLSVRLENAIYAYTTYVWKAFLPVRLAVFYPHPGATLAGWRVGLATLFLLSVSGLVWWRRAARPYLITAWLWFLGTLVPVIGLIQVGEQAIADRYAYVPLIGIFVITVWGASDFADSRQFSFRSRAKAAAIVMALFVLFASDQIRYWRSAVDLWSHTVDVTKDNFLGEQNLGAALLQAERYPEALPHFQKAVRLRPLEASAHLNLAGDFALSERPRDAIAEYETAIPLVPDPSMRVGAYATLGRLYSQLGNYSKARTSYQEALRIDAQRSDAREGLAKLEFSDALRNVAESPSGNSYLQLGRVLQEEGRPAEARSAFARALELNPKLDAARKALDALKQHGK